MSDWKRAVARLYQGKRDEGGVYRGTAFMISNSHLLTCFHVVRDLTKDDIRLYDVAAWDAGVRKVRKIISDENIDIALLELVEPTQDADLVSVCREQADTAAYKILECTGFSSVSGDRNYFSVQVGSYDGEYNLYDFPVPVGRGMSGSPLVYQNQLMGISRLQDKDNSKTYLIPLRDFQDLLNEHVFPEGDKIETVLEPEADLDGTKIPFCDFDSTIREHIDELFVGEDLQKVAVEIFKLAGQDPPLISIGELLCSSDVVIESVIGWLTQAVAEAVQAMPREIGKEQQRQAVKENAKKILGWLVLRIVDPKWVKKHGEKLLKKQKAQLTVRITESSCVEIIVARILGREGRFKEETQSVWGKEALGMLCTEAGIEPMNTLDALFRLIWQQRGFQPFNEPVTPDHEQKLLKRLKARHRSGRNDYLTVSLSALRSPLRKADIINFHKKISFIKLILLCVDDAEPALLVDDGELHEQIFEFFQRVINEEQA